MKTKLSIFICLLSIEGFCQQVIKADSTLLKTFSPSHFTESSRSGATMYYINGIKIDSIILSRLNVRICYDSGAIVYIVEGTKIDPCKVTPVISPVPFAVLDPYYFDWDNFDRLHSYGNRPVTNNYNLAPPFAPVSQRY